MYKVLYARPCKMTAAEKKALKGIEKPEVYRSAVEAYEVSLPEEGNAKNPALLLDIGDSRYVALLFESGKNLPACSLADSLLVTVRKGRAEIQTDIIRKSGRPDLADLRLLSWYDGRFEFVPTAVLTNRLVKARELAAPLLKRVTELPQPNEIPTVPAEKTDDLLRDLNHSEDEKLRGR
jgi:hypothetical protein